MRMLRRLAIRYWPLARAYYRLHGLPLAGRPMDVIWYFAYGSNMHDSAFRGRRGLEPLEWRTGRLRGYRLRFNLEGRPRGKSASANLSRDCGTEVWGVLYRITRTDLLLLDRSEGVPGGRYRQLWAEAEDVGGSAVAIVTYIADGKPTDGDPSLRYFTQLREGAHAHGLPTHYIEFLDKVEHAT